MFGGLGWPEVGMLMLLGLFVFGPERLPVIAADLGKALRKARAWAKGMGEELKADLGPEVGDLDLRSLHPREFIRKHLFEDDDPTEAAGGRRRSVLTAGEPVPWDPDTT